MKFVQNWMWNLRPSYLFIGDWQDKAAVVSTGPNALLGILKRSVSLHGLVTESPCNMMFNNLLLHVGYGWFDYIILYVIDIDYWASCWLHGPLCDQTRQTWPNKNKQNKNCPISKTDYRLSLITHNIVNIIILKLNF